MFEVLELQAMETDEPPSHCEDEADSGLSLLLC